MPDRGGQPRCQGEAGVQAATQTAQENTEFRDARRLACASRQLRESAPRSATRRIRWRDRADSEAVWGRCGLGPETRVVRPRRSAKYPWQLRRKPRAVSAAVSHDSSLAGWPATCPASKPERRDGMTPADDRDAARSGADGQRRGRRPAVTARVTLPLAAASRRLRRPAGRPPSRTPIDRTGLMPSVQAGPAPHRADALLPRGLSVEDAAAYVGVAVRDLWRRVERGELRWCAGRAAGASCSIARTLMRSFRPPSKRRDDAPIVRVIVLLGPPVAQRRAAASRERHSGARTQLAVGSGHLE